MKINEREKYFDELMFLLEKETKQFFVPVVSKLDQMGKEPFHILISTVLSLRTKDQTTLEASLRLFKLADTPEKMLSLNPQLIEKTIFPVGFYKTKAKNIQKICSILVEKYGGKVPSDMDLLLALPGVGRKTANLVLAVGFKLPGMCVDTHVHRISNRLGILKTDSPLQTEMVLREILPVKYWEKYNEYLVSWGQNICKPISPFCSKCPIKHLCQQKNVTHSR